MAQILSHSVSPTCSLPTHFLHIWGFDALRRWWLFVASCVGGLHLYSCEWQSVLANIPHSTQQGSISEQNPKCYSSVQTDWWINTTQNKALAHHCNISFGPNPKGEGSAAGVSTAKFDSVWAKAAHKWHLSCPQVVSQYQCQDAEEKNWRAGLL